LLPAAAPLSMMPMMSDSFMMKLLAVSPPQDHPHIYIDMGAADTILCPYCGTRFRFDPRLTPFDADPPDSFFGDQSAACAEPQLAFTRFGRLSPR